jgi:hypothetical protein
MNLKKIIGGIAKDKLAGAAASKIAPMADAAPKKGWKAKAAGVLAIIGVAATALSQYLGS